MRSSEDALQGAIAAIRAGRLPDAERMAAGVLATEPGHVLAAHVLGTALLMQGRAGDAIAPFTTAARGGDDPANETLLARALAAAGRPDEALAELARAQARRPPYPLAFVELASQLGALGRHAEAVEALEQGLALAPDAGGLSVALAEARIALAGCLLDRGDHAGGEAALRAAVHAAPQLAGLAAKTLAGASHGRVFLRPSALAAFLQT